MESSIAVFLERQSACELLPTDSEVKILRKQKLKKHKEPLKIWKPLKLQRLLDLFSNIDFI